MSVRLLSKLAAPAPRYTSYPTAPHFHAGIDAAVYRGWLEELPDGASLSLYLHIPYCDRLCWFCACHTKQTLSYAPVQRYLEALKREIATVGAAVGRRRMVSAVHFGGGSPTLLRADDMVALSEALSSSFEIPVGCEISVEIDPSDMDEARFDALARAGMTRASLGVQDFEPAVQKAINRMQSYEQTRWAVESVRERGVASVNLDVLYGLPHQTEATLTRTLEQVLTLSPDRIALFGYAHVPWFKKHQTMIDEAALPDIAARYGQAQLAARLVQAAGYVPVGLDHFSKPSDGLAQACVEGRLRRNFQGYTVDEADALIGLGASAVGRLPQGYVQNLSATGQYERALVEGGLAVARGIGFTPEDRARSFVIERLMCDFGFSGVELRDRFGPAGKVILREAQDLAAMDEDGLFLRQGDNFVVPQEARPFVRNVAARFDTYLRNGQARHSQAI
ncbi:MAG: oxygen-independent coproporphyrinogen III oxidase [Rhizobiaceae bacterium]|nr:oxygen-independent coproporphyrinogen III oxidase [Rhizobiaceae bacterium]